MKLTIAATLAATLFMTSAVFAESTKTVLIDLPDVCHTVGRVEGANVYLNTPSAECHGAFPVKVPITIGMEVVTVNVYRGEEFWQTQTPAQTTLQTLQGVVERAKLLEGGVKPPAEPTQRGYDEQAKKLIESLNEGGIQEKIAVQQKAFQRGLGAGEETIPHIPPDEYASVRVYLFASSSIPMRTLRNYIHDMAKLPAGTGKVVIRGVSGDGDLASRFVKTTTFLFDMKKTDPDCDPKKTQCTTLSIDTEIDPLLFTKYEPSTVPAILFVAGVSPIDPSQSEGKAGNLQAEPMAWVAYGDQPLADALTMINEQAKNPVLARLIEMVERANQ